jgi:hypothetical protein
VEPLLFPNKNCWIKMSYMYFGAGFHSSQLILSSDRHQKLAAK